LAFIFANSLYLPAIRLYKLNMLFDFINKYQIWRKKENDIQEKLTLNSKDLFWKANIKLSIQF